MTLRRALIASGIFGLWLLWLWLLLYGDSSGLFFDKETNSTFSASGAFGDSFGAIASLMTTIAAVGVYLTFSSESEARKQKTFEENFFSLLRNFESIVAQTRMERTIRDQQSTFKATYHKLDRAGKAKVERTHHGRHALAIILYTIRNNLQPDQYKNIKQVARAYNNSFDKYVGSLGHYFRSLYHIYRLIDTKCPKDHEQYSRIVRAQLSNPELCLLAYNCTVGEGRTKFKKLVVQYSVLHNLHRVGLDPHEEAELDFFVRKIPEGAFRFEPIKPVTYDD